MKTLDEVIKALEICLTDEIGCSECPFDDDCKPDDKWMDALHYLKEYRKHLAQELDVLCQKKYELETNMKLDALLQEKLWEKRK